MKFLTISKMKDTASTVPPSVMRPLLEATLEVMNQEKKEGKVLEYYFIPGGTASWLLTKLGTLTKFFNASARYRLGCFWILKSTRWAMPLKQ